MIKQLFNLFSKDKSRQEVKSEGLNEAILMAPAVVPSKPLLTEADIEEFVSDEIQKRIGADKIEEAGLKRFDPLLSDAARLVVMHQQGSTSLLQRKMKLGYNRAGAIIDQLETLGIVGRFEGSKAREVFINDEAQLDSILARGERQTSHKKTYFDEHVLESKLEYINQKVEEAKLREALALKEELKAQIKTELLAKENLRKEQEKLQNLRSEVLREMIENGEIAPELSNVSREPIPQSVKDLVWNRDGGKCVICGLSEKLEFDHIIPFSKGGSNTYRNIQLLCEACNRAKSAKIGG